ncbi:uncharacterized protein CLUP02_06051 [Colletotrichum lupini]|uniref:Uncharacterized protein n=1 Tax=Colletotrichum lupini TaxID=145971 RepID=A0A9Q8SNY2_9PEZI|nr:uncharacterized protein CLUP02_06051 [Colletotrichum lupini]UQC80568.1 hypothetical protein CLUP02_06051 [Colletotrichum lupini]
MFQTVALTVLERETTENNQWGFEGFKSNSNHMAHFQARIKGHWHADNGSAMLGSHETNVAGPRAQGAWSMPSKRGGGGAYLYLGGIRGHFLSRERTVRRETRAGRGDPQRRTVGRRVFPLPVVFIFAASIEELWEVQKRRQVDEAGFENKKGRDRICRVWRHTRILYHRRHHDAYLLLAFSCFLFCFLFFTSTNLLQCTVQHSYHTAVLVSLPFFSLERASYQYIEFPNLRELSSESGEYFNPDFGIEPVHSSLVLLNLLLDLSSSLLVFVRSSSQPCWALASMVLYSVMNPKCQVDGKTGKGQGDMSSLLKYTANNFGHFISDVYPFVLLQIKIPLPEAYEYLIVETRPLQGFDVLITVDRYPLVVTIWLVLLIPVTHICVAILDHRMFGMALSF